MRKMPPRAWRLSLVQDHLHLQDNTDDAARFITESIATSTANLCVADLAVPDDFPEDQEMGQYKDDMD